MNTETITDTNKLLNAAAIVVENGWNYTIYELWWKRRIQQKIKSVRRDLNRLDRKATENCLRRKISKQLNKQYNISDKRYRVVLEELKQRLTEQSAKLKRYEHREKRKSKTECLNRTRKTFLRNLRKNGGITNLQPMLKRVNNSATIFGERMSNTS